MLILFSITAEGIEFEVLFKDISCLIPFQAFFCIYFLLCVSKQFVKYVCLILFSKVDKRFVCYLHIKWVSLFETASFSFMNLESTLFFIETDFCTDDVIQCLLLTLLTLQASSPQNGQTNSNNSSATADQLFECV